MGPMLSQFGQVSAKMRPVSAAFGPHSTKYGADSAEFGDMLPTLGQIRADVGRIWAEAKPLARFRLAIFDICAFGGICSAIRGCARALGNDLSVCLSRGLGQLRGRLDRVLAEFHQDEGGVDEPRGFIAPKHSADSVGRVWPLLWRSQAPSQHWCEFNLWEDGIESSVKLKNRVKNVFNAIPSNNALGVARDTPIAPQFEQRLNLFGRLAQVHGQEATPEPSITRTTEHSSTNFANDPRCSCLALGRAARGEPRAMLHFFGLLAIQSKTGCGVGNVAGDKICHTARRSLDKYSGHLDSDGLWRSRRTNTEHLLSAAPVSRQLPTWAKYALILSNVGQVWPNRVNFGQTPASEQKPLSTCSGEHCSSTVGAC